MNKFIYKVIKWLEDPESVSQEERDKSKKESYAAYDAAAYAAYAAYDAADNNPVKAAPWVNNYLQQTGENKQDYLDAIEEEKVGSKKEATKEWVDGLPPLNGEVLLCATQSTGGRKMNKHVYKVIKWLEDPKSVSQEERDKSKEEADDACDAARNAAHAAAYCIATYFAADNNPEKAARWVNDYLQETGENKQDYLDAIEQEKVLTDTNKELSERVKVIGREHYAELEDFEKQPRYKGNDGLDWIDEFSRDNSIEDFRAAMRFTIGKYEKRLGKKDAMSKELYKISDYYKRWSEVEKKLEAEK